jgi:hypothetical protein
LVGQALRVVVMDGFLPVPLCGEGGNKVDVV